MRRRAEWMEQIDDRILELLAEAHPVTADRIRSMMASVALPVDYSSIRISNRLDRLEDRGLIETGSPRRHYVITETGREYLEGDLDARTAIKADGVSDRLDRSRIIE